MFSAKWFIFIALIVDSYGEEDSPTVEVLNGILKGTHETSYNGKTFSSFQGVPYAKPPVGILRFEAPKVASNWTGVWVANTKPACLQVFNGKDAMGILGDEDCLYLNVYVPRKEPSKSDHLDVIVDIHGGSFMLGSGTFYAGPRYLMDREVILVTINYRLGPFGFLSTEDEVVPGNNGLKDQNLALQWVNKNIAFFGGNPNSVTLTGMSAGGASVHYHYLSPLSKGYFHRGISISGTALNPWALQKAALEKAKTLGKYVGCDAEATTELVECLRRRSGSEIIESVKNFFHYNVIPFAIFGPVVEPKNPNAFLTDHPYDLLVKGQFNDVPWITSITKDEGLFPSGYFYRNLSFVEDNWEEIGPLLLDYTYTASAKQLPGIDRRIKKFYFKYQSLQFEPLVKLCTDRHFAIATEKSVRLQAKSAKSPVYLYILNYRGQHSISELYMGSPDDKGVAHGDDVLYIFNSMFSEPKLSETDEQMKDVFLNLFTSYASKGVPEVTEGLTLKQVNGDEKLQYLNMLNPQELRLEQTDELAPQEFWDALLLKENGNRKKVNEEL